MIYEKNEPEPIQEEKFSSPSKVDFQLILSQIPNTIQKRIFNFPRAESEQDKNLLHVIRQLHKLDFDDGIIESLLFEYPISKGKDLHDLIKRSRLGNPSENHLSREFASQLQQKLRYCKLWGKWLAWTGTHWEIDEVGENIEQIRLALEQTEMPEWNRRWVTVKNIELMAQNDPLLRSQSHSWDTNQFLLGTPNGTVDLKTGKLRVSYQEDMITKITSVAPKRIPIPKWFHFLLQATHKNKDYIRYLQRVCGYCLTGNTREHALFFLYGAGGNGKGVFLNTITSILKDYSSVAPLGTFIETKNEPHSTNTAMLRGARLVIAQEIQEGKVWDEVKIKSFTGGDPITAHFMHQDNFTFIPNFKLIIAGNHEPQLRNVDDATTRRFNKLPFTHKPKPINQNLLEELKLEHEGILQWMINGCLSWQKHGLAPPQIIKETTEEYFESQDSFSDFLDEFCEINPQHQIIGEKLLSFWYSYAARKHLRQGTEKTFKEQMLKHGFKYNKNIPVLDQDGNPVRNEITKAVKYMRGYKGVKIKSGLINPIPEEKKIKESVWENRGPVLG